MKAASSMSNVKRALRKQSVEMDVVSVDSIKFQSQRKMEVSNAQVKQLMIKISAKLILILIILISAVKNEPLEPIRYVDPAMIGVLVGMALMFIIICVVLRMFSR